MVSSMASHFLRLNDREGHALGREILRHKAAAVLRRHTLQQAEGVQGAKAVKHAAGQGHAHVVKVLQPPQTRAQRGAAGALESICCIETIRNGVIPPTINYETPDPECDLDITPNTARERKVDIALNINLGFGGHNAVLAFKRI